MVGVVGGGKISFGKAAGDSGKSAVGFEKFSNGRQEGREGRAVRKNRSEQRLGCALIRFPGTDVNCGVQRSEEMPGAGLIDTVRERE